MSQTSVCQLLGTEDSCVPAEVGGALGGSRQVQQPPASPASGQPPLPLQALPPLPPPRLLSPRGRTSQVWVLWKATATIAIFVRVDCSSPPREGWAPHTPARGPVSHHAAHRVKVSLLANEQKSKRCSQMSSSYHGCVCARARTTARNCTSDGTGNTKLTCGPQVIRRSLLNFVPHYNLLA